MTTDKSASLATVSTLSAGLVLGGVLIGIFADSWLGLSESLEPEYQQTDAPWEKVTETPPDEALGYASDPSLDMLDGGAGNYVDPISSEIVIELDRDGAVRVQGRSMPISALKSYLCSEVERHTSAVLVTIKPHDDCLFQYVLDVIAVCDDCDVASYKIAGNTLGDPMSAVRT